MRDVTLVMAYYENASMLDRHYKLLRSFPSELAKYIRMIVVDDGSPDNPAKPPSEPLPIAEFQLYRMGVDIPWNQDACRNLAAYNALDGWMLMTDMDHMVPKETWEYVLAAELERHAVYKFMRISEPALGPYKPHPNSFMITKKTYWRAGGYDERFAGIYGTDGRFRNQLTMFTEIYELPVPLIRVPREVTPDASTTRYERIRDDHQPRKELVRSKIAKEGSKPLVLSFPWERVV